MAKETIKAMLEMIDAKIEHIEDISADNRAIIVKLVKQNNTIVKFLRNLEIQLDQEYDMEISSPVESTILVNQDKIEQVKEMLQEFKNRSEDLQEFEKELEKHKGEITPGQIGES